MGIFPQKISENEIAQALDDAERPLIAERDALLKVVEEIVEIDDMNHRYLRQQGHRSYMRYLDARALLAKLEES